VGAYALCESGSARMPQTSARAIGLATAASR
jgi:hypothetical protein